MRREHASQEIKCRFKYAHNTCLGWHVLRGGRIRSDLGFFAPSASLSSAGSGSEAGDLDGRMFLTTLC